MRLTIVAVGRLKAGPERELAGRYLERAAKLGRSMGLHPIEVVEIHESRARRPEERIAQEGRWADGTYQRRLRERGPRCARAKP